VRAKGWRFELDHERIRKSDTWALAPAEVRPWLLMLWMTAWEQSPCGSLPDSDELIAAHIGMPSKVFAKHKDRLMRGWWLAEDGRLYHGTLVERVTEMLAAKDKERTRKAEYRRRMDAERAEASQGDPNLSHGTDTGQTQDSHGSDPGRDDTGTGTGTGTSSSLRSEQKPPRKRSAPPPPIPRPDDVAEQVWSDWVQLRTKKRSSVSLTAVTEARAEAEKAGVTLERFLAIWCSRGSQGLSADWLTPTERGTPRTNPQASEPAWRTEQRERTQQAAPGVAVKTPGQFFVDAEEKAPHALSVLES